MSTKDSGLRIRIERPLREAFVDVCRRQDKPAAQVIREFMRGYIAQQTSPAVSAPDEKSDRRPARGGQRARR